MTTFTEGNSPTERLAAITAWRDAHLGDPNAVPAAVLSAGLAATNAEFAELRRRTEEAACNIATMLLAKRATKLTAGYNSLEDQLSGHPSCIFWLGARFRVSKPGSPTPAEEAVGLAPGGHIVIARHSAYRERLPGNNAAPSDLVCDEGFTILGPNETLQSIPEYDLLMTRERSLQTVLGKIASLHLGADATFPELA